MVRGRPGRGEDAVAVREGEVWPDLRGITRAREGEGESQPCLVLERTIAL